MSQTEPTMVNEAESASGAQQGTPKTSNSRGSVDTLMIMQVLYILFVVPWFCGIFAMLFACDSSSNPSCIRLESIGYWWWMAYPIFLAVGSVLAWPLYFLRRPRFARAAMWLPLLGVCVFLSGCSYVMSGK